MTNHGKNIPTPHIDATDVEEIANTVLMPGDPLRAQYIADHYLENVKQFNQSRGMLGFTGEYNGKRVSVMGSGMGMPSSGIYFNELFGFYDVDTIIRVGTAGSMQESINLKDIVVATAACTDSSINEGRFGKTHFTPTPDFNLLFSAKEQADHMELTTHFGPVKSSDAFYSDEDPAYEEKLRQYGVLAVEMEAAALFTIARRYQKSSLALFTISDSLVTKEADSAKEREQGYTQMMELALEIAPR